MQKIWHRTKRIIIFIVSSLVISWFTAFCFLTLITQYVDLDSIEELKTLKNKEELFYNAFFADALIAFLLVYLVGIPLLKTYKFKTAKFIALSITAYLLLFLILALFA